MLWAECIWVWARIQDLVQIGCRDKIFLSDDHGLTRVRELRRGDAVGHRSLTHRMRVVSKSGPQQGQQQATIVTLHIDAVLDAHAVTLVRLVLAGLQFDTQERRVIH